MANYISEDEIEQRAIQLLLEELDYDEHLNCYTGDDMARADGSKRREKDEVILEDRLIKALTRINGNVPATAIKAAADELMKGRSGMSLMLANKEVYELIKDGFAATIINSLGKEEKARVRYLDFNNPCNNEFLVVNQMSIKGLDWRRPDILIYVNGIPFVFFELKNSNVDVKTAYDKNLHTYIQKIPALFHCNAFCVLSNAVETKVGAFNSEYGHFFDWLRVDDEKEHVDRKRIKQYNVSLEYLLRGLCAKDKLIDYIENFILYHVKGAYKIIAKNHQFLGVNNAIESFRNREAKEGKLGVFWHTQGSGKSFSMIMFTQKILRKFNGDYTFFIVTDRDNLDGQIYRNFLNTGAVKENEAARPRDGVQLREYLSGNKRYVFSLIQKFRYPRGLNYPLLSDRKDIIVLVDEAHRTQYKDLAENMRVGIPRAQYIAFTGTPLLGAERLTNRFFGDYISEYNFRQSYEDGSTVPLIYDKRVPEVQVIREGREINEDLARVAEEEALSEEQESRLEREFASELSVIRNSDRLKAIARDIVWHFPRRGFKGRGMVISIDRFTAMKMYELVQHYWYEEIVNLRKSKLSSKNDEERKQIDDIIDYMNRIEMAVVISYDKTDDEKKLFEKRGVDITPHIRKMENIDENGHDLEYRFQEIPDDPFQLVFVSDMWLTGFDSPTVSDLYMEKPMIGHSLMQAIARANRVSEGKICGRIIDYYGVFRNLKKALAEYATGDNTEENGTEPDEDKMPVEEKEIIFNLLKEAISEVNNYCLALGIKLSDILALEDTFKEIDKFESFADVLLSNENYKNNFFVYSNTVESLYEACKPDIYKRKDEFPLLEVIRYLRKIVDRKKYSGDLENARIKYSGIIDQSISTVSDRETTIKGFDIKKGREFDLSKFDFDKLKEKFLKTEYKHIEIEDLKLFIEDKLARLINQNVTRADFAERLRKIVEDYNTGSLTVENYFDGLVEFSKQLRDEEQRHIRENLSSGELELFDLIRRTNKNLTKKEEQLVKLAAKNLLKRLIELKDELFVADWYKHDTTRLNVLSFVKDTLNAQLPNSYTKPIFDNACDVVIKHLQYLDETGRHWAA